MSWYPFHPFYVSITKSKKRGKKLELTQRESWWNLSQRARQIQQYLHISHKKCLKQIEFRGVFHTFSQQNAGIWDILETFSDILLQSTFGVYHWKFKYVFEHISKICVLRNFSIVHIVCVSQRDLILNSLTMKIIMENGCAGFTYTSASSINTFVLTIVRPKYFQNCCVLVVATATAVVIYSFRWHLFCVSIEYACFMSNWH